MNTAEVARGEGVVYDRQCAGQLLLCGAQISVVEKSAKPAPPSVNVQPDETMQTT